MSQTLLCVDLGGTKALVAKVTAVGVIEKRYFDVDSNASKAQMNEFLCKIIEQVIDSSCQGIVIGVPSMVLMETGEVIETVNIPDWKNVQLKPLLSEYFNLPVLVHNDANCFAMGEFSQGRFNADTNLIGICLGTGLGAGVVLNGQLYTGKHSAAGEFGSFAYRNGIIENYTSGQFFIEQGTTGKLLYERALANDVDAQAQFSEFGKHLAHAINQVILAFDPDVITLGGSVAKASAYFLPSLRGQLAKLVNPIIFHALDIRVSTLGDDAPLLGGYALFVNEINYKQQLGANYA
ncbi:MULTISPECIES: ROK family protein [Pseudoalteromonas]|uniref:ROK family protein n=1 Tax=Pseudoalteromonas TaxID=53246 RepID=UPI0002EFF689|nr:MULTISPECIES: ROK family protein [Pseudoalteromonas]MCF6143784.1 glucokinase [Pseudoalteromonas mariniglutinosa NCIMB 1770]